MLAKCQIFLVSLLVFTGCVSVPTDNKGCEAKEGCRPYKVGIIKMAPELDASKELAAINTAGWVLASDVLIGAVSDKWVVGISIKTRQVLWWFETDTSAISPITLAGSWVLVGLHDGHLVKLEALTGKKVWETKVGKFIARGLTVSGTSLFAHTVTDQLFAIDFQTGALKWIYDAGSPANLIINGGVKPLVRADQVYIGASSGEVHAVDLESGKQLWRYNPSYTDFRFHDVVGELVFHANRLVMTRHDGVVSSIIPIGESVSAWTETFPALTNSKQSGGVLYLGGINGELYALDVATGRHIWSVNTGQPVSTITMGEKFVYIAGTNGRITAVDIVDGAKVWSDDIGGTIDSDPIIFEDKIYFATGLKVLYGYKLM